MSIFYRKLRARGVWLGRAETTFISIYLLFLAEIYITSCITILSIWFNPTSPLFLHIMF